MAEYIERESLARKFQYERKLNEVFKDHKTARAWEGALMLLHDETAADVAPVVHGEWEKEVCSNGWNEWDSLICKNCGTKFERVAWPSKWNFCPFCGADMRERRGDDAAD